MNKRLSVTLAAIALAALGMMSVARAESDHPAAKLPRELTLGCGIIQHLGTDVEVSMKLILVPAGEFMMGGDESPEQVARKCNGEDAKAEWFQNEQPRHRVRITKPFYMGIYVVTQPQYEAVMAANRSNFKGEGNPVEQVAWEEATEFCRKLSLRTGMTIRLPTEAEWEYACRAGTTTAFNTGETISTDQANYNGNYAYGNGRKGVYRQRTVPVGTFAANGFGLYEMHGNVWEWCQDWYDAGYYKNSPTDDPPGPATGEARVCRGGSWLDFPRLCRSAYRFAYNQEAHFDYVFGFRVVCAPGQ